MTSDYFITHAWALLPQSLSSWDVVTSYTAQIVHAPTYSWPVTLVPPLCCWSSGPVTSLDVIRRSTTALARIISEDDELLAVYRGDFVWMALVMWSVATNVRGWSQPDDWTPTSIHCVELYPVYTRKHTWSKRIQNTRARRVLASCLLHRVNWELSLANFLLTPIHCVELTA